MSLIPRYFLHSWMSPFPLKIGINILCRQAYGICSVFIMRLNTMARFYIEKDRAEVITCYTSAHLITIIVIIT